MFFAALLLLTDARNSGDTHWYVTDVLRSCKGSQTLHQDASHLLWRPLGAVINNTLHFFAQSDTNTEQCSYDRINFIFYGINIFSGFVCLIALFHISLLVSKSVVCSTVGSCIFLTNYTFLNYTQSGTSYIPALACYLTGIYFVLLSSISSRSVVCSVIAAVSFISSICLWMPFVISIPIGAAASIVAHGLTRARAIKFLLIGFIAGSGTALFFAVAAWNGGADSISSFLVWFKQGGSHGGFPGFPHAVYGFANSFVELGYLGKTIKQILINRTFDSTNLHQLAVAEMGYFLLFYFALLGVSFLGFFLSQTSFFLTILLALLIFNAPLAVFFDGGSSERYLVLTPFFSILLGSVLATPISGYPGSPPISLRTAVAIQRPVCAIYYITCLALTYTYLSSNRILDDETRAQHSFADISPSLTPNDTAIVINYSDPIVGIARGISTSPYRHYSKFTTVTVLGSTLPSETNFSVHLQNLVSAAKLTPGRVFISRRLLAEQPELEWGWVDGEIPGSSWSAMRTYFSSLPVKEGENYREFVELKRDY